MPELPEVQTIIDDLSKYLIGKSIDKLNIPTPSICRKHVPKSSRLKGVKIQSLDRRGKHILVNLTNNQTMIVHLKMTGKLIYIDNATEIAKHTHFIMIFDSGELHFNDIRRFGFIDFVNSDKLDKIPYLSGLGPDALDISTPEFISKLRSRNKPIKSALMDQNIIAGLGNIYADESLFSAGIRPSRIASSLSRKRLEKLYQSMREILRIAIQARGSSVSDYVDGSGIPGTFQNQHKVYGRTGLPCVKCGAAIKRQVLAGRSSHYCSRCQR